MSTRNTSSPGKKRRMKLSDAARYLGVSAAKITRMIQAGELTCLADILDRRRKIVKVEDLDRIKAQSPMSEEFEESG